MCFGKLTFGFAGGLRRGREGRPGRESDGTFANLGEVIVVMTMTDAPTGAPIDPGAPTPAPISPPTIDVAANGSINSNRRRQWNIVEKGTKPSA